MTATAEMIEQATEPAAPGSATERARKSGALRDSAKNDAKTWVCEMDYAEVREVAYDLASMPEHNHRVTTEHRKSLNGGGYGASWYGGCATEAQAQKLFEEGWVDGAVKALALRDQVLKDIPAPQTIKRRPVWQDAGDELSYDRLRSGQIDTMWRVAKRAPGRGPRTVRLAASIGGNCHLNAEQMFWSGACLLAVADLLENAGYRTELLTASSSTGHRGKNTTELTLVTLKLPNEPLRPDAVAFAASHAAFFRHYLLVNVGHMPGTVGMAHGCAVDPAPKVHKMVEEGKIAPVDFVFPPFRDRDGTVEAVKRALAEITGDPRFMATAEDAG